MVEHSNMYILSAKTYIGTDAHQFRRRVLALELAYVVAYAFPLTLGC